jgi:PAS domain S-box-containing protein
MGFKITTSRFGIARHWTIRGLTASLILITALLPVFSAVAFNFLLDDNFSWRTALLNVGIASLTLALIAYPTIYLLNLESNQARRWDKTEQDFQFFIDEAADMVFVVTLDGHITDVNQRACESLGYNKAELLNLTMHDLDSDCVLQRNPDFTKKMYRGEAISYASQFRSKQGKQIPIESRARMINWLEEPHYVEFVADVSRRLEVKKQIDESRDALEQTRSLLEQRIEQHSTEIKKQKQGREVAERYASSMRNYLAKLIDSMPSALIAVDQDYRVMQWNTEAEEMTQVKAKQAIGHELAELFPRLCERIQVENTKRDLLKQSFSFHLKTKINQQPKVLEVMVYPIFTSRAEEQGEVIRIDDITQKLKVNETLIQTEKMLSLGGLAAGMAHEINNPLGAIMQTAQNIKRRLSHDLPRNHKVAAEIGLNLDLLRSYLEQQRVYEFLDAVLVSGERAANIVGDMLRFAKPSNQEAKPVALQDAVAAAIRLSAKDYNQRKQFDFRDIDIRQTFSPQMIFVLAQKNQLEQVLLNLLINAAQALTKVKQYDFKPIIELIIRKEGQQACIEVIDNGPGMNETTRKRVFEPFFTTKDEQTGTGLGLSVSYFIICEQLNGSMSVISQPGKGCRFTIHLPLLNEDGDKPEEHDEQIELPL